MGKGIKSEESVEGAIPLRDLSGANVEEDELDANISNKRSKSKLRRPKKFMNITIVGVILLTALILIIYLVLLFLKDNEALSRTFNDEFLPPDPDVPLPPSSSILQMFSQGAVCSDNGICSQIGRDIFHRGGNTIDAAIATLFCNGLETMQSMGLGGGFLMNIFIKNENKAYTLDAKEIAPLAATQNMFVGKPKGFSMKGPLSIAVPGEVMGYWEAHKRFGSIPWKELIEPTIKICEDGFQITRHMSESLKMNPRIKDDYHLRNTFINETTNDFHKLGSKIYPSNAICDTYRLLAENGGTDFYNGSLSKMLIDDLRDIGSNIIKEDLLEYEAKWHNSIAIKVNKDYMHVVPPAGSGVLLAFIINILQGYNFSPKSISSLNQTALTYHRIIEAFKYAFGKRSEIGDMDFNNLTQLIRNLTSQSYGEIIRNKILDDETINNIKFYGAKFWSKTETGTSHLSIIGPNGDAVSVTSSINYYFGSGHSGRRTGIIFNSGMDDFSTPGITNYFGLPSSEPNLIKPKKRAMSSMCPTIISNDEDGVKLVIGSAGGTKIVTSIAFAIIRYLWFQEDIKQVLDAPRIHHQLFPNNLDYEFGNLKKVIHLLQAKGHKTTRYKNRGSAMCGISKNRTAIYANADYRKEGEASGL